MWEILEALSNRDAQNSLQMQTMKNFDNKSFVKVLKTD